MDAINALPFQTSKDLKDTEEIIPENLVISKKNTKLNAKTNQKLEPDFESNLLASSFQRRYLMTQVGQEQLAFPLQWVSELILVESSQILTLPFYDSRLLGVLQYKGDVVPLIVASQVNQAETAAQRLRMHRTLTTVRLNQSAGRLAGVGLVVDRVIEHLTNPPQSEQLPQIRVFQLDDIPPAIWQPL